MLLLMAGERNSEELSHLDDSQPWLPSTKVNWIVGQDSCPQRIAGGRSLLGPAPVKGIGHGFWGLAAASHAQGSAVWRAFACVG